MSGAHIGKAIESADEASIKELMNDPTSLVEFGVAIKAAVADKKQQVKVAPLMEKLASVAKSAEYANSTYFSLLTLDCLKELFTLTADAKMGKSLAVSIRVAIEKCEGKAILANFCPIILETIEKPPQNKWKVKVVALELFNDGKFLELMSIHCKRQLNADMADIVRVLVACSKEVRAEIKNHSSKLLEQVGQLVKCTEIRAIADKIVGCLKNFGNMKLAQETLYLIANTTFLSYVDAASFALLFPIVERAMKEKQFESKKNGIMIVGAAVVLIEDPEILKAYLPALLPILKDLAIDPIFEIQRESAKALGSLGKNLPTMLENNILPWCLANLESTSGDSHNSENERTGAAHSLSEILNVTTDKTLLERVLNKVLRPRMMNTEGSFPERRDGAFKAIEFLCKVDAFEKPAREYVLPWVLHGLQDPETMVHEQANKSGTAMINEFGGNNSDAFVFGLADAVLSFNQDQRLNSLSSKGMCMGLFRRLVERVSEMRKYGTDMWSMDCCSRNTRLAFICLLCITRNDVDPEVRRQSNKVLSEQLQSVAKTKKEVLDVLLSCIKQILSTEGVAQNKKESAERALAELRDTGVKDVEFTEDKYECADVSKAVFKCFDWSAIATLSEEDKKTLSHDCSVGPLITVVGAHHDKAVEVEEEEGEVNTEWTELEELTRGGIESKVATIFKDGKMNDFLANIVVSVVLESLTAESALKNVNALNLSSVFHVDAEKSLTEIFASVYANYRPKELKVLENPEEILCHVEDLMLMYGGGHMLLKDTTFELRKGKRYGVVGRNGTGKTTLMNLLATGGVPGVPKEMTTIHVKPEVLDKFMTTKCKKFMSIENPGIAESDLEDCLEKVLFPKELQNVTIGELSGGWRMRLLIAAAMMKKADVLLLDEPTNHLDTAAVKWLADYLVGLNDSAIMVISHDPFFLNTVCTNIINYNSGKLVYYDGNFDAFTKRMGINSADAEALLAGQVAVSEKGVERADDKKEDEKKNDDVETGASDNDVTPSTNLNADSSEPNTPRSKEEDGEEEKPAEKLKPGTAGPDRKAKIVFPIAGKVKGLTSLAKPVLEVNNLTYAYNEEKGDVIQGVSAKVTMNSRIHIRGVNGAGKTTFMNLLCGEVHPNASACPQKGSVNRHRNCRLAYMAQQHMHHMSDYMETSPYIYIQKRYANGYDGALQERLTKPQSEEELEERKAKAKQYGKYGNMIKNLIGRQMRGKDVYYEAQWENLDDSSKNSWLSLEDLRKLGCESFALAYDDRAAAAEGGVSDRPLSQREIVKHLEQFGITEELALNRNIGMFSAGQKSKVSLAAAFWIKPHLVALDEPTNYIDMETLDALVVALQRFKGGVITISHSEDFVSRVCNETWHMEGGQLHITKNDEKKK